MEKNILLLGAGKSATCLVNYLLEQSNLSPWRLTIADSNLAAAKSKINGHPNAVAIELSVQNDLQRAGAIASADIVISLLPPALHYLIALDCLQHQKNLLTASYVEDKILALQKEISSKKLLFLCEMGLDPGIDHMSAMRIIHRIQQQGGKIHSFYSHCGGLIAPLSDNNPWHYKISWNPRNVVLAGAVGAIYKQAGAIIKKPYQKLFEDCPTLHIEDLPTLAYYPNRDSISYMPIYGLEEADTFVRTTLRYPVFCESWAAIVKAGLTNHTHQLTKGLSFNEWSKAILPHLTSSNQTPLQYLGLFEPTLLPDTVNTSADVLQYLLETKLMMKATDQDMIVMQHQIGYTIASKKYVLKSSLIVEGENNHQTAMAKTVGLPLGIAAKLILENKIQETGLHIPILSNIYEPVLNALEEQGIVFNEQLQEL
jgi:saccharopine dehydrogenase-like NADP-dependent oxidoreductase